MNKAERFLLVEDLTLEIINRFPSTQEMEALFENFSIYLDPQSEYKELKPLIQSTLSRVEDSSLAELKDYFGMTRTIKPLGSPTFWKDGYFKLFLSHLSSFRKQTSQLKEELFKYGISSFVAHNDIEPSREWQTEIILGLNTMDAFCPLLMDGFKESNFCDQEVGFAIARDVQIFPIMKNRYLPYGFLGSIQGIEATETVGQVAYDLFEKIGKIPKCKAILASGLIKVVEQSSSGEDAKAALVRIKSLNKLDASFYDRLKGAVENTPKLLDFSDFISDLNTLLKANEIVEITKHNSFNFDDDLPF